MTQHARRPVLLLGETHTALIQHSAPASQFLATYALNFVAGEPVSRSDHPIPYAISPDRLTSVDCPLTDPAAPDGGRAVGTVTSHAAIIGRWLLQATAFTRVEIHDVVVRRPWSHYLARPGWVEAAPPAGVDLVERFLEPGGSRLALDLAAIATRTVNAVQTSDAFDRRPLVRTLRGRLRWAATSGAAESPVSVLVADGGCVGLRLAVDRPNPAPIADLCGDVAQHAWLIGALRSVLRRDSASDAARRRTGPLADAVDHLVALWMPSTRVTGPLLPLRRAVDEQTGESPQWQALLAQLPAAVTR